MPNNPRPSTFTDIATENGEFYIKDNQGNMLSQNMNFFASRVVTLGEIQLGVTLINGVKGKKIRVNKISHYIKGTNFVAPASTKLIIQDNSTVPNLLTTTDVTALVVGGKLQTDGTVMTINANMWELLPDGASVVVKAEPAFTAGGTVYTIIQYELV